MEHTQAHLEKFSWKGRRRAFGFGAGPESDWKIIFISTVILLLLIIILSIFMFVKIDKGDIFVVERPSGEKEKALDTVLLKETVSYYQNKASDFESVLNTPAVVPDPSL